MVISYVGEEWEGSANNSLPFTVGHHVLEYLFISPLGRRGRDEEGGKDENREKHRLVLPIPPPLPPTYLHHGRSRVLSRSKENISEQSSSLWASTRERSSSGSDRARLSRSSRERTRE